MPLYNTGFGGCWVLLLYIITFEGRGGGSPLYIMALGGVLGFAVVYHGFRGGPSVLPLYIMALGGGGSLGLCRCISWL